MGTSITLPLQVQRLDATSRSPIQALIVESLQGASTIRAFGLQVMLKERGGMMLFLCPVTHLVYLLDSWYNSV